MGTFVRKATTSFILLIALFLSASQSLSAQFYLTGSSKAATKWRYIENEGYKLVYPEETDSLAHRYFALLNHYGELNSRALGIKGKKVPVVLYPFTTKSNGTVSYAPKIAELYTRPPLDSYSQNWEEHLLLHETRHIMQISHFTRGAFKPLSWIFGEQITGLALGVYSTRWEMEGDAVLAETEFSPAGRGREASFLEYYRMSQLSGEERSRVQWRYGSTREYTPNIYAYGYMTYSAARHLSGNDSFSATLFSSLAAKMYSPAVVRKSYVKASGYNHKELFENSLKMYGEFWREDLSLRGKSSGYTSLLPAKAPRYYTEYRSPVEVGADSVIALKYSYDAPVSLVLIEAGKEKILRPFSGYVDNLRYSGGKLYYTETIDDIRWEKVAYERAYTYDVKSGKIEPILDKGAFYEPLPDIASGRLALIEYPVAGGSAVNIYSLEERSLLASFPAPESGQITSVAWCDGALFACVITADGVSLYRLCDKDNVQWVKELSGGFSKVANLAGSGGKLYFISDIDGVNNIYCYDPSLKKLHRETNSEFGVASLSAGEEYLYYTNLTPAGRFPVYKQKGEPVQGHSVTLEGGKLTSAFRNKFAEELSASALNKEAGSVDPMSEESLDRSFKDSRKGRYRRGLHLFNFHSWAPFYYNVDKLRSLNYDETYEVLALGATAYSQNAMGTALTMLGYSYQNNLHSGHASFEYRGWYPVFGISADYNSEQRYSHYWGRNSIGTEEKPKIESVASDSPFLELRAYAYIPFRFNSKGWFRSFTPQVQWLYENTLLYDCLNESKVRNQKLFFGLQYSQSRPVAQGGVYPRWSFNLSLTASVPLENSTFFGEVAALSATACVPGFVRQQGLKVTASYQRQFLDGKLLYSDNLLPMPRGIDDDYYGKDYYRFAVDYAIPFNFKGLDLGFLAYVKQLQVIPFADICGFRGTNGGNKNIFSVGCDLVAGCHLLRLGAPVKIGVRQAIADSDYYAALLFTIDLN